MTLRAFSLPPVQCSEARVQCDAVPKRTENLGGGRNGGLFMDIAGPSTRPSSRGADLRCCELTTPQASVFCGATVAIRTRGQRHQPTAAWNSTEFLFLLDKFRIQRERTPQHTSQYRRVVEWASGLLRDKTIPSPCHEASWKTRPLNCGEAQ